jgi:hypothetical protein
MDPAPELFQKWLQETRILLNTIEAHEDTQPNAIIYHFMTQCIRAQFSRELEDFYDSAGTMIRAAIDTDAPPAEIVFDVLQHRSICPNICVSDIRNLIVFEALSKCGVILDTYFDRELAKVQPAPTPDERQLFETMAHGMAKARDPRNVEVLSDIVRGFYIVRVTRTILGIVRGHIDLQQCTLEDLNGYAELWIHRSLVGNMIQNVWDVFRDLYKYEYSKK